MGFFESLFYTIWRGIAIGILISAPMGPVGILCIQRTLYKGRKTGLYTGIGAAISDLFYCILTGFGLSFIEEFLEKNQNIIQLAGSIVLIAFAIYLFKKNPASSLKTPQEENAQISPHKNILGGFLFTFSNPLILFLIIGLFARFNFSIPEIGFYYYIAGYIAIFCGAVIWWEFVTFSVNKLRAHFNLRSMWLINRIIGVIILLFAIVGIVTGVTNLAAARTLNWNQARGYLPFYHASPNGIMLENKSDTLVYDFYPLVTPAKEFVLKFRVKNLAGNPSKKYTYTTSDGQNVKISNPHWGFFLVSVQDTVAVTIKGAEKFNGFETEAALNIVTYIWSSGKKMETSVSDNIDPYDGDNLWSINAGDNKVKISVGNKGMQEVMIIPGISDINGFGFFAGWSGRLLISDVTVESIDDADRKGEFLDSADIEALLNDSDDPLEGYWALFDSELEESLVKMGGDYTFACVGDGNRYSLYYISGASVNSKEWLPGDLKARLYPSPFPGIYDVEWIDSMKEPLTHGIKAQEGEGQTLLLQFPYHSTKLRLRKITSGPLLRHRP